MVLTVAVFADLDRMSSACLPSRDTRECTGKNAISTYVELSPCQSPYVPGTIAMEDRYMNLLMVLTEASTRFPKTPETNA